MATKEWVNLWRAPALDGLELHHARYITHRFSRHMHDYYVIGVIEAGTQAFWCRGARHINPTGGVFVINPGDAHTGEAANEDGFIYRTFYPDVDLVQRGVSEIAGCARPLPFFLDPVIRDNHLSLLLCELHVALTPAVSPLECESRFLHTLAYLVTHHAEFRPPEQSFGNERYAIQRVRHYIDAYYM